MNATTLCDVNRIVNHVNSCILFTHSILIALDNHNILKFDITMIAFLRPKYHTSNSENMYHRSR